MSLIDAATELRDTLRDYPGLAPVGSAAYILNPLDYAWDNYASYLGRFAPPGHTVEAIFLGMNPGPWGMAQTGVPFGSPDMVREFLGIDGEVRPPARFHPKRPIGGVRSSRTEVSGQRLWGAIRESFSTPEAFFARFFIANYCPLVFQSETGANLTPDKLPRGFLETCTRACDRHLELVIRELKPRTVIGVGKWAETQARRVIEAAGLEVPVGSILHPSPASPAANNGWAEIVRGQLAELGHGWPVPAGKQG